MLILHKPAAKKNIADCKYNRPMPNPLLLQHHIQRLERKQARCEAISRRYAWIRLAVFLAGGAATWSAAAFLGSMAGWMAFIAAAILFAWIESLHRRVDGWAETFRIWQAIYREQAARLELDWEHIPLKVVPAEAANPALALDLDLTGPRSLHALLDTTISRQGSQRLANWLTTSTPDLQSIAARQAVVRELAGLPRFRNRLALIFRKLSREPLDSDSLLAWLQTPYPEKRLRQVLSWAQLLVIVNITLFVLFAFGRLPPVWILSTLVIRGIVFWQPVDDRGIPGSRDPAGWRATQIPAAAALPGEFPVRNQASPEAAVRSVPGGTGPAIRAAAAGAIRNRPGGAAHEPDTGAAAERGDAVGFLGGLAGLPPAPAHGSLAASLAGGVP